MAHKHIHKIHRHLKENKKGYLASTAGLVSISLILVGTFLATRGSTPHMSELAITEHSVLGKSAGSVIPASGESAPTYPSYPGYPGYPGYPSYPGYPGYPSYSSPTYPSYPSYSSPSYPGYPGYPSYSSPSYPGYPSYESYESYEGYPNYPSYSGPPSVSYFSLTPRSVERGGLISISWSIYQPNNNCKITAAVQKPASCDASCQSARNTASTTINNLLTSSNTNSNDPNGSRPMLTALRQGLNSPYGYARGVKSLTLQYSTTFTLSCGTSVTPVKSIIYVTDRTEG